VFNTIEHIEMSLKEIQSLLNMPILGPNELLKCALGIKTPEIQAYCLLVNKGPISIQEATNDLNKSRSTAQRLLQNLVEKGLATREEQLIGLGGYRFVYRAVPPEILKETIEEILQKWYHKMLRELDELPMKIFEFNCSSSQIN
jgi:predicted transcriptional regulator